MNKYKCCMGKVGDAWIFSADMLLESVVGKIDKLVRLVFEVGKYRLNRKKRINYQTSMKIFQQHLMWCTLKFPTPRFYQLHFSTTCKPSDCLHQTSNFIKSFWQGRYHIWFKCGLIRCHLYLLSTLVNSSSLCNFHFDDKSGLIWKLLKFDLEISRRDNLANFWRQI